MSTVTWATANARQTHIAISLTLETWNTFLQKAIFTHGENIRYTYLLYCKTTIEWYVQHTSHESKWYPAADMQSESCKYKMLLSDLLQYTSLKCFACRWLLKDSPDLYNQETSGLFYFFENSNCECCQASFLLQLSRSALCELVKPTVVSEWQETWQLCFSYHTAHVTTVKHQDLLNMN